ncbi:putative peroxiredoxin YgaF [Desulfosarcina cetonica]|uniref:thioredoxin-dependent thiol peroxidase n=1 Tax=Desulfosarcina cetonica TaxID=90730 RepID=UPI0006CF7592|nr:thioredoxin-dependent thiol peroxidase [Desulfosarcina cetonica]VTR69707.1 putative peroxiredoxin YgaF [Desulfosarcina cetonica]
MTQRLTAGDPAPDFTLNDKDGTPFSLSESRGKWVVLYFYPRDNTSGCTTEAKDFSARQPDFNQQQALVIGISADSQASHAKFAQKHGLSVTLLSDPEHLVLERYGVWQKKKMAGREYMGIVRTTFLINPEGIIREVWEKVKVKDHADAVYKRLCSLS